VTSCIAGKKSFRQDKGVEGWNRIPTGVFMSTSLEMSTSIDVREPEVQKPTSVSQPRQVPLSTRQVPMRPLFSDSLLETGDLDRDRRTLAGILSFAFQCTMLGLVLIVPLIFADELPKQQLLTFLVLPAPLPPPPPPAAPAPAKVTQRIQSNIMNGQLRTPAMIPQRVQLIRDEEAPPPMYSGGVIGGVPGGIPGGQLGGIIGEIISSTFNPAAVPRLVTPLPKRIRMSQGVTKGMLIQRVEPKYPAIARDARIRGDVVLRAIISKTGEIENLDAVSGHPMLVPAAIDAVRQWRYRPFLLNGIPLEVETVITITFQISG
jgi:protein TonB